MRGGEREKGRREEGEKGRKGEREKGRKGECQWNSVKTQCYSVVK